MRQTSFSSGPKESGVSAASAARAEDKPSSPATCEPTLATSMPRPTSARNSRRVRTLLFGGVVVIDKPFIRLDGYGVHGGRLQRAWPARLSLFPVRFRGRSIAGRG